MSKKSTELRQSKMSEEKQQKQRTHPINLNFDPTHNQVDCLVVLNGNTDIGQLTDLFEIARNVILADGGANKVFGTALQDSDKIREIIGDMDSINPEVKQHYISKGIPVNKIFDCDSTDFEKAIKKSLYHEWNRIIAVGVFGDRMDHTLSVMSNTLKLYQDHHSIQIFLMSAHTLMYLFRPEVQYQIEMSDKISHQGCGLIPFGKVQHIQTTGFKWNLGKKQAVSSLEWGNFISSSNEFMQQKGISVLSSHQIFLTCNFVQRPLNPTKL